MSTRTTVKEREYAAADVARLEVELFATRRELNYARQLLSQVTGLQMDRKHSMDGAGNHVYLAHMPEPLFHSIVFESRR